MLMEVDGRYLDSSNSALSIETSMKSSVYLTVFQIFRAR